MKNKPCLRHEKMKRAMALVLAMIMAIPTLPVLGKEKYKTNTENGKTYVIFGSYEQDGNIRNGTEPIEWEVLAVDNNKVLVVSRYVLDFQQYNDNLTDVTWENSTLRKWLKKSFYNIAFSKKEKNNIITANLQNPDNTFYRTEGGSNTKDKIFCLSVEEILRYYDFDKYIDKDNTKKSWTYEYGYCKQLKTAPTKYAKKLGLHQRSKAAVWWLRSPGYTSKDDATACDVYTNGKAGYGDYCGNTVTYKCGVRPAMYIKNDGTIKKCTPDQDSNNSKETVKSKDTNETTDVGESNTSDKTDDSAKEKLPVQNETVQDNYVQEIISETEHSSFGEVTSYIRVQPDSLIERNVDNMYFVIATADDGSLIFSFLNLESDRTTTSYLIISSNPDDEALYKYEAENGNTTIYADAWISVPNYNPEINKEHFTIVDQYNVDYSSYPDIQINLNDNLITHMTLWNMMLYYETGYQLSDIGFTNYPKASF